MNIIVLSYLFVNAWTDWKKREINILYTVIFSLVGIIYKQIMQGKYNWYGMIPGMVLWIFSFLWKNHIGAGDGVIVMFLGWMCGITLACNVLMRGLVLAVGVGAVCCLKEKRINVELPFVPFLLGSYMLEIWI